MQQNFPRKNSIFPKKLFLWNNNVLEAMLCTINQVNNKPTFIQDGVCDSYRRETQFHHVWRDSAFSLRLTAQVISSANCCCGLFLVCANSLQMQKKPPSFQNRIISFCPAVLNKCLQLQFEIRLIFNYLRRQLHTSMFQVKLYKRDLGWPLQMLLSCSKDILWC